MVNFNFLYEALQPAINAVIGSTAAPQATANTYGIPQPIYNYAKQKVFDQFLSGNTAGTRGGAAGASPGGFQDLDISAISDLGAKIISGLGDIDFSQASDFALKAVNLVQANTKGNNGYGNTAGSAAAATDGTLWSTMFDGLKSTWGYAEAHPVQSFMLSTLLGSGISIPTLISTLGSVAGPMGGVVGEFFFFLFSFSLSSIIVLFNLILESDDYGSLRFPFFALLLLHCEEVNI